jgi:hypothetical protein
MEYGLNIKDQGHPADEIDITIKKKHDFSHALCQEPDRVVQQMNDVAMGWETPPEYSDLVFPKIPPEFYNDNEHPSAKEGPRKGHIKTGGK